MGPAVQIYTATHPLEADIRRAGLEYALPIRIGNDVWIGGGAIILPGVTIGDGSVVGAGSVVVHDVPPASVVVGNPARIVRTLNGGKDRLSRRFTMNIALIGATGFVGSALLQEALDRGHEVTAIVRHPEKLQPHAKLHPQKGDVYNEDEVARLVAGHDVVISAFSPGWSNPDIYNHRSRAREPLLMVSKRPA
ncbi:MAG TPA: NAD(P)H-binding protein [Nitrospiraceae bacterium]|nr:NAD(P)H-binding protein [Nitrospiraceae bacterium]